MSQRFLALLLVGAAAVAAAGGGAYLAFREAGPSTRPGPVETMSDREQAQQLLATSTNRAAGVAETQSTVPDGAQPSVSAGSVPGPAAQSRQVRSAGSVERPSSTGAEPGRRATRVPAPQAEAAAHEDPAPSLTVPEPPLPSTQVPAVLVAAPAAPPEPEFIDVTVPAEAVIGLQIATTVTSDRAQLEDRVDARVTRDVRADGRIAIPAGSRMEGVVTVAERGGKIKERARLAVRFHTLVLADGTRVPVLTETIYREGDSPARESTAKIGGAAVGGALLGAILGGGKGAAIGGSLGAASGTAMVMAGDRDPATLPAGSSVTVRLHAPVTITVER